MPPPMLYMRVVCHGRGASVEGRRRRRVNNQFGRIEEEPVYSWHGEGDIVRERQAWRG